jgi:superfamily I DNA and/or RNA helicase
VDIVVERLSTVLTKRVMLRLVAFSRDKASVPEHILGYTNYNEDANCFVSPDPDSIKSFQLVAITTSYAGKLPNLGIIDHFSHVFIDEAGHSIEPEALGCLAMTTKQDTSNPPVIVLAGDPKQLGPIIRSDISKAFGLEKSLLERLSQRGPYQRRDEPDSVGNHYDKNMITKLIRNYRSHARILDIPNATFYNGDLIAEADMTRSHRFVDWEHLPKRGFPIIFHGVEGEDMREANSPSWFNPDEAQYVKMYVDLLVKGTRKNRCMAEEIGIITPYHRQVQKIRKILEAHGYGDCKVGSVEEFQGSERPVIILSTVRSNVDFIQFDQKHKVRIGVVIGLSSYCIFIVGACLTQPCQLLQQLGFLANEKRFNVAVTRAQSLLIMIGNPFTLENDSNWGSMIEYVVDGGGYVGIDYTKRSQRRSNHDVFAIENQFDGIHINEDDDFVHVSHVTVQEGPAWRLEE